MLKKSSAILAAALLILSALSLHATQTENHALHAVPIIGNKAPTIDGDLSDWDLSGQIFSTYDIETLSDMYSANTAAMYDSQNLYIGIHWKSPRPLGNTHDPRYQAARAWAGDCIQLRFKTDRITHITAWYYAPRNEPAITISYGKSLTEPFGGGDKQLFAIDGWHMQEGLEMAFQKDTDNKGYTQEIKIPWTLITTATKYTVGDQFNLGIEYIWGAGDWPAHRYADSLAEGATSREFFWSTPALWGQVILEPKGSLHLPPLPPLLPLKGQVNNNTPSDADSGPVEIHYTLPKNSRVTLAIDDPQGRRIRNLLPALPRNAGQNTEHWDGLDDDGTPVPPGDYTFKILTHDTIHATYALSFANPGHPSWPTADGHGAFYADHTAPQAVATSPNAPIVALACPMGEAGNHLIACDLDGQRLWGLNNRNAFDGTRISLATDGATLWVASEGKQSLIYRVGLATGRYTPWKPETKNSTAPTPFPPLDLRASDLPTDRNTPNLTSIALSPNRDTLAAAFARENAIRLYNPDTGALLAALPCPAPQALAYTPDGTLLVLSENRLLRAPDLRPITTTTFSNARALATDLTGNIYISTRAPDQNIKVLTATGTPLREIGARGGRPANGPYNPAALRNPAALAIDALGHLWVAEETTNPKRTSIWNPATGALIRDLAGTTTYAAAGSLNPYDITTGFSDNTVYRLDWRTNTYAPVYSLAPRDASNTNLANPDLFPPAVHTLTSRAVLRDNRLYIYTTGKANDSNETQCTLYDEHTHAYRSAAHIGLVRKNASEKYKHPFFANHENELYVWSDENGDGLVQPNELHFTKLRIGSDNHPARPRSLYWGQLPAPDGTITYLLADDPQTLIQFPITATTPAGAPIYDIAHPHIIHADRPIIGLNESYEGSLMGGSDGRIYINQDPLITIDRDGHINGGYPNRNISVHGSHKATAARPGYLIGPSSILGTAQVGDPSNNEAGEVFLLNGNLGENYPFTQDALYIQTLFRDTRTPTLTPSTAIRGMNMDDITAGGESFGGNFIRTPDGHTYLTLGSTDARVLEITGLETIRRMTGTFTYTKDQYATAQKLRTQKIATTQPAKSLIISSTPTTLTISPNQVQISADSENLHLTYKIKSPHHAPKNTGQDEHLLFKTGDAVDLMLAPADTPAAALRILITKRNGHPIAILNQKIASAAAGNAEFPLGGRREAPPKQPSGFEAEGRQSANSALPDSNHDALTPVMPDEHYDFSSPWRTITFARVIPITEKLQLVITPTADGYAIAATIPWSVLNITPAPNLRLRLDVGVLTGDSTTQTTSRRYWSNQATNLVNDIPGEADLTPELWGAATLK